MATRKVIHVSGRVQGVFFRDSARRQADGLGLSGWAKNLPDGRVEVVAEGDPDAVDRMVEWCRQGSEWAEVDSVEVTEEEPRGDQGFTAR